MAEDVKLQRTRSVLHRGERNTSHVVCFQRTEEEMFDGASLRSLYLDPADVKDLGDPSVITVTIHPGDLLNGEIPEVEEIEEFGRAFLEPVERSDGRWDWRLVHENTETLCGSDQGYETRSMAFQMGSRCVGRGYSIEFRGWES